LGATVKAKDYFKIRSLRDIVALVLVSAVVSLITFLLAILSDYSVKMFYGQLTMPTDFLLGFYVNIVGGLSAILMMGMVILIILIFSPTLRITLERMFGIDELIK
jgi:hypothetical protein